MKGRTSTDSVGVLAQLFADNKEKTWVEKWKSAGVLPLRRMYYAYWERLNHEPSDVYELIKGYSYLILSMEV